MEKKQFSKFFIASLKRSAQNLNPLLSKKARLSSQIAEMQEELSLIQQQIDAYNAPIIAATGYPLEALVEKVTSKGANKWVLKYPDTVVPVTNDTVEGLVTNSEEVIPTLSVEAEPAKDEYEANSPLPDEYYNA